MPETARLQKTEDGEEDTLVLLIARRADATAGFQIDQPGNVDRLPFSGLYQGVCLDQGYASIEAVCHFPCQVVWKEMVEFAAVSN